MLGGVGLAITIMKEYRADALKKMREAFVFTYSYGYPGNTDIETPKPRELAVSTQLRDMEVIKGMGESTILKKKCEHLEKLEKVVSTCAKNLKQSNYLDKVKGDLKSSKLEMKTLIEVDEKLLKEDRRVINEEFKKALKYKKSVWSKDGGILSEDCQV